MFEKILYKTICTETIRTNDNNVYRNYNIVDRTTEYDQEYESDLNAYGRYESNENGVIYFHFDKNHRGGNRWVSALSKAMAEYDIIEDRAINIDKILEE